MDGFLAIANQFNIKIMFVIFDECWLPNPKLGPQPDPIPGVHNSQWVRCPGQTYVQDTTKWPLLKQYTIDILSRFSNDSRVVFWDLYNEPQGSGQVSVVLPLVKEIYSAAVVANPQQPLTFGVLSTDRSDPLTQFELNSSDIISFHNYAPLANTMEMVGELRQWDRPLICTEYMARTAGSTFHTHTFYFHKQGIGAINWGLVAGKTQTYFPWGSPVNAPIPLVWFHDIFNNTGEAYSPIDESMLITVLLILIFFLIIYQLLRNSSEQIRFPGPKRLITPPKFLFDLLLKISTKTVRKIFLNILYPESALFSELTVPLASQYYTLKYGDIVQINLFNQPTIIISNCDFADYILRRNGKNYTLRFGNKLGLEYLGMENKGIIWNRNIQRWKYLRLNFFQKALNSKMLDDAKYISNDAADHILKYLSTFEIEANIIDTMDLLRSMTFTITCHLFLDLPIGTISLEKTKSYVRSVVEYFKAWEYFLLKPKEFYVENETKEHQKSISQLNEVVEELISLREKTNNCLFINSLLNALENKQITKNEMNQCVLEMLIAGTDTSSVTMFYFLLALSDRKQLEEDLIEELKQNSYSILTNGLKESMRYKPVGPVIMRCAINDDIYQNIHIRNGTNIIINLVDMHRKNEDFLLPNQFDLINVQDKDLSNTNNDKNVFLPFGIGPKECVGRWLAKVEMEVIIEKLVLNYSLKRANGTKTLEELQTRWDIAQQPTHPGYMRIQKRSTI